MNEIIIFLLLSLIGIVIFIIFYLSKKEKLDNFSTYLLILASCIITFGFYAPFAFTDKDNVTDFINTGQIGDTFGGIMNPFISIAAIIVTGLAFYAQYKANKQVKDQFELQKFENQFYEMLRLHKENVNEIEIEDINGKIIKGRAVFFEMRKELILLFHSFKSLNEEKDKPLDKDIIYDLYDVFFFGKDYKTVKPRSEMSNDEQLYEDLGIYISIEDRRKNNMTERYITWKKEYDNVNTECYKNTLKYIQKIKLQIPFLEGHHQYLGYYYRNLFRIVKFVSDKDFLDKEEKLNYLQILRSQLSNYEQELLFYNWLSGYGEDWENLDENKPSDEKFFTEYKMIRNFWYDITYKDIFIKEKLKELVEKYKKQGGQGNLFEIGDDIDKKNS